MFFNKSFSALAVALLFSVSAQAATIVAYSGNTCNGNVGNTVPCDGSCRSFSGRHSLKISGGGPGNCVTVYNKAGCQHERFDQWTSFRLDSGVCRNINTGYGVESFRCSTDVCLS
ncbi:hypothetical protein JR316_0013232 [Psilocybe cubensis]|uniref:Uncharacterized protein n=2 Tax=Psilocybe cubensis TaxID=181762 RepID=A0ACB8GH97_PSICU|nr:hypothetical protein JR316_0013232 [Psilocybe cubensis]KAH9474767.1 hypothetical protein JR316_0013232 [Psilocybe cubensis]